MSTSERFTQLLDQYRIVLEDDAVEYINSMLYDMTLSSCNDQQQDDIHESINAFLLDANIDKNKRDDFFTSLFSSIKPQQESYPVTKNGPALLMENKPKKDHTNNVQYEEHLIDDVKIPKQIARRINKRNNNNNNKTKRQQLTQNINKYNNDEELDIIAISQQSRFHTETLETSNKDIDLHGVQISVVSQHNGESIDLLVDAHLKLKPFTRYGLIGQNGVGKSILMRCLADNILVGLPQNLNILHITQLEDFNESTTAVQEVLDADKNATIILKEYQALQTVVGGHDTFLKESKATQAELNKVVFSIMQSRIKDKVDEASRLAIKRSGLRGREARKELIKIEKEYDDFCQRDPQKYITAEMVNDIMLEVYGKYEMIDQEERLNRAKRILRGLGFSENQSTTACISTLSGGWRMRIALAKLLFKNPDILLLDEPTNHLDLSAILWLQEYLIHETDDMTVVVVSHDREFLNNVTEETIILKDKQLKYHAGNYQDWENTTEEQRIRKQALLDSTEKKKNKILVSIQENLQRAKTTGDDKRHGMINSRRKKLDRLGMEKTEDGKRFKLSQHRAGYHSSSREEIIVEKGFKTASIKIPEPIPLRYNGSSLYMNEVTFRYQGMSKNIIESFSIHIGPHSRIAFIGPNGCGKSTLLNLLTSKIQPTKGEVYRHPLLRIGYFSQHIVDHELNLDLSPVEYMMKRYPTLTEQECRAHFGIVGLSGNHIVLQKIRSLSGGQRNRVAFAIILYEQPQVLILDEITNHLDMGTVEMLVDAFKGFSGALIVVSHDIWFLKQIFEQSDDEDTTTAKKQNEIYTIKQGRIQKWEKGIDSYVASVLRNMRNQNK